MTADIHTCSYSCERPGCIRAQRDYLAARLTAAQQPAAPNEEAAAFDANFLRHIASVCRAAYDLCQPKPQRTPEDVREYNGGLCLSELTSIADEIERRLAAVDGAKETDLWRCTVCGRVGTVGRCCGEETRERANMEQLRAEVEVLAADNARLREALQAIVDEVSDGLVPYSSDSYLPAHLVEQARAALGKESKR